jgi:hypothetical protein
VAIQEQGFPTCNQKMKPDQSIHQSNGSTT